tara:strand:+ start:77551 stop:78015 length:465 start_codon:yes stop_codon:yes gene_type:complete
MAEVNPQSVPARIVVHEFSHAVAALAAAQAHNRPITILSAVGAARAAGAGWWRELVTQAQASASNLAAEWVLDCGDEPGMALAALREGVQTIALDAGEPIWSRVAQIATQCDARVVRIDRAGALDLANSNNPQRDCDLYLSPPPGGVAKPGVVG